MQLAPFINSYLFDKDDLGQVGHLSPSMKTMYIPRPLWTAVGSSELFCLTPCTAGPSSQLFRGLGSGCRPRWCVRQPSHWCSHWAGRHCGGDSGSSCGVRLPGREAGAGRTVAPVRVQNNVWRFILAAWRPAPLCVSGWHQYFGMIQWMTCTVFFTVICRLMAMGHCNVRISLSKLGSLCLLSLCYPPLSSLSLRSSCSMPGPFLAFCEYLQSVLTTTKRPTSTDDHMPGRIMAWPVAKYVFWWNEGYVLKCVSLSQSGLRILSAEHCRTNMAEYGFCPNIWASKSIG